MIGRTISHYTVLEKLGAGGMGDIYKAQDTRLNRFVAMKVLSTANAGDVERRRRFVQEAQAASALNHPNIITIHDVVSNDEVEFMVMEFVSGVTLDDLIPKHGLNVQKTLDCAVQMADALQAAHTAGIVHRDLKPANVMVTASGLVKVLDFGIAKLTGPSPAASNTDETLPIDSPMTVEGSILGTVSYMSPEQAQARAVDPRSDIFSFGLVVYEMLTGQKAFSSDSALGTLSAILRDEAKPIHEVVEGVPPELEQIVYRAMRKDPAERWQTMEELRAALLVLKQQSDSGVLRTQIGALPVPPVPQKKSGPMPLVLVAGGVVVLGAVGGGIWWMNHQKPAAPAVVSQAPAQTAAPAVEPPPPTVAPADTAMTNASVLQMVDAKVPDATIINQIRASKTNFDLSTAGVIQLTKGGVKGSIIEAMRAPQSAAAVPPSPAVAAPAAPTAPVAASPLHTLSLQGGLPFNITLAEDVPLKLTAGQKINFAVSKDVKIGEFVVIAKGTPVAGEVVDPGDGKKLLIVKNKATFKLSSVDSAGGSKIAIRVSPGRRADEKSDRAIEQQGTKNKDLLAPTGTEYVAYVEGDQTVTLKH